MNENNIDNIEVKEAFDEYYKYFQQSPLKEKQVETITSAKELLGILKIQADQLNIKYDLLLNTDVIKSDDENWTEDDFAETMFIYLESIKEIYSKITIERLEGKDN